MRPTIKFYGRSTLAQVQRARNFVSFKVFKMHNKTVIVGATTPFFSTFNSPTFHVYMENKVSMSRAINTAYKKGRLVSSESDMKETQHVQLRLTDISKVHENEPIDVYYLIY